MKTFVSAHSNFPCAGHPCPHWQVRMSDGIIFRVYIAVLMKRRNLISPWTILSSKILNSLFYFPFIKIKQNGSIHRPGFLSNALFSYNLLLIIFDLGGIIDNPELKSDEKRIKLAGVFELLTDTNSASFSKVLSCRVLSF